MIVYIFTLQVLGGLTAGIESLKKAFGAAQKELAETKKQLADTQRALVRSTTQITQLTKEVRNKEFFLSLCRIEGAATHGICIVILFYT